MRSRVSSAVVLAIAALAAGCGGTERTWSEASGSEQRTSERSASPRLSVEATAGSTSSAPSPTDAAEPPIDAEPGGGPAPTQAGPLTPAALPEPSVLGPDWSRFAEDGGSEEGFVGNGTFARARDAHHAAYELLPIGCAGARPAVTLPVPSWALTGSFADRAGRRAYAVALRFETAADAAAFLQGFAGVEAGCGIDRKADLAIDMDHAVTDTSFADTRYYAGRPWTQVVVASGAIVTVLGSPVAFDQSAAIAALRA